MGTEGRGGYDRGRLDREVTGAARAGDLVSALFGAGGARKLSSAQQAARAWFSANGDRERAHTTGVWLRKSGRSGTDPIMVVRLDSGLLAQELGTNKELYLARLAHAGVSVSDIRFDVGSARGVPARGGSAAVWKGGEAPASPPPRPLSDEEMLRVERATEDLPDGLRQSAARAMRATMARRDHRND